MATFDPSLLHEGSAEARRFYQTLTDRVRDVPGVKSVALSTHVPMQVFNLDAATVVPEGYTLPAGKRDVFLVSARVDEHYFETMRIPIVLGRALRADDDETRPRVVVVNEVTAKHYWPGQDPIGKRFRLMDQGRDSSSWVTVVGVAKTSKYLFLAEPPVEYAYFPFRQGGVGSMILLVQSAGDPAALAAPVRDVARSIDARQPVYNVHTMDEFYRISTVGVFTGVIRTVAAMGAMGLMLALVGLYGLVAYAANRRTKEIGIRIALGAGRVAVLRLVVQQGVLLAVAGLGVGLVASIAAGIALQRAFPDGTGVIQSDNVSLAIVAPIGLLVTLLAAFIPADRASRVDPMIALRYE
jgi:predicted permease